MKKKLITFAAVAVLAAFTLTACTSMDTYQSQGGADNSTSGEGSTSQTTGNADSGSTQSADSSQGTATDNAADPVGDYGQDATYDAENQIGDDIPAGEFDGGNGGQDGEEVQVTVIPEESQDAWSGVYVNDIDQITISGIDESTISFAFAQCGIEGRAAVSGNQAVYNGDDNHVVVFTLGDAYLEVEVASEEDFDASASPLIGTYTKQ